MSPLAVCPGCTTEFECIDDGCKRAKGPFMPSGPLPIETGNREIYSKALAFPRLVKMIRKLIAAEAAFTKDTGIELDDQIADAVKEAKLLLRELGE